MTLMQLNPAERLSVLKHYRNSNFTDKQGFTSSELFQANRNYKALVDLVKELKLTVEPYSPWRVVRDVQGNVLYKINREGQISGLIDHGKELVQESDYPNANACGLRARGKLDTRNEYCKDRRGGFHQYVERLRDSNRGLLPKRASDSITMATMSPVLRPAR